jgi:hypothetical protein
MQQENFFGTVCPARSTGFTVIGRLAESCMSEEGHTLSWTERREIGSDS